MDFHAKRKTRGARTSYVLGLVLSMQLAGFGTLFAQSRELQTTSIRLARIWAGMIANGGSTTFNPSGTSTFFPNDYGIIADMSQYADAITGAGVYLTAVHWPNHANHDSVESAAVYQFTNQYLQNGRVIRALTNYLRYQYPQETINKVHTPTALFGTYNPSYPGFRDSTFDEIAEVVDSTIFGVTVDRKILVWSQTFNNDYIIADLVFTNIGSDTLDSLYINLQESGGNSIFSNGSNPVGSVDPTLSWQHYYGGRPGDSLRVFYEYSADDPRVSGDNMGAPQVSSNGRLINPNMSYYAILHASAAPYDSGSPDADDPLQPKVTYIGVTNRIPYNSADDIYGSKNFSAIRGTYSDQWPMPSAISGTHHGLNNDELGTNDYTNYIAGAFQSISYRTCSFGPYTFLPGKKIHIVIASGFTGIGYQTGQQIGNQWLDGTLQDPPNTASIPEWNARTGLLPGTFQFPSGATQVDMAKDRWISLGIDSVMLSAWRAKWNYEHDYAIPQAPPPPATVTLTTTSLAIEIDWSDPQAEALSNFAGYRIMRRISNYDTVEYSPIYDSDSTDLSAAHTTYDSIKYYGAQIYYYVQSKARIGYNDPNADPTTRGKIMYSGRNLDYNTRFISPTNFPQSDLSKIRIVPNPYNISDPLIYDSKRGLGVSSGRVLVFYNLPPVCTIKIFTENGDLVTTIDKSNPQQGSYPWNMLTSSQQLPASGVYIAVFQTPDGATSYQKFIIVR
ncbi:MAG TPA: hypothetical protein VIS48_16000 [Candidatus Kryptonia bacterium]